VFSNMAFRVDHLEFGLFGTSSGFFQVWLSRSIFASRGHIDSVSNIRSRSDRTCSRPYRTVKQYEFGVDILFNEGSFIDPSKVAQNSSFVVCLAATELGLQFAYRTLS
jgi:hypothetical protein